MRLGRQTRARYVALGVVNRQGEIVCGHLKQQGVRHPILTSTSLESMRAAAGRLNAHLKSVEEQCK